MRFQHSYRSLFQSPYWPTTLMAGSLCMLVPPFGAGLFAGYLLEMLGANAEADAPPAAFDMGRAGEYFSRGLRPTLVRLLFFAPLLVLFGLLCTAIVVNLSPTKGPTPTGKLLTTAGLAGILAAAFVVSWLLAPVSIFLTMRTAAMPASLGTFVFDFLHHVGKETWQAQLFVGVTGLCLVVLGLLPCGFGVPTALALALHSQYHLLGQLQELYGQRATGIAPAAEPAAA